MKTILAIALSAALLSLPASAQIWIMSPTGGSPPTGAGGHGGGGGGGCTANGQTDWSNACDIPMGVALGVL